MQNERWNDIFALENELIPSSIRGINDLPDVLKRKIYSRLVPEKVFVLFNLSPELMDEDSNDLIKLHCEPGSSTAEMSVYHRVNFQDPIIYGQITDTSYGQIHILLYVINDPDFPRFDIDRLPDGTLTQFGTLYRNIPEETKALKFGLAPGQLRRGLRLLGSTIETFEDFANLLGHDRFYAEPLFYHNAIILERAGFAYLKGRKLMEQIEEGFLPEGSLLNCLDGSTPFRNWEAASKIRSRSWALHDGVMNAPFTGVTMYKVIHKNAGVSTTTLDQW